MMINSVYTNKEIFLRELISNASDAIDKLCYRSLTDDSVNVSRDDCRITVAADKDARTLTVSDNGIGMTKDELENNLGVIAGSGSFKFKNELEDGDDRANIIGQFGVGFYSAFMTASRVTVVSKAYGSEEAYKWVSSGVDGYTVTACEKEGFGTDVILEIKPDGDDEDYSLFLEDARLKALVKKYSDYIRWPILIGGETVNSMVPIWQRSKGEAPDEDCIKFYKDTFREIKDPAGIIRINAEGTVSFRALLFIPGSIPFDYYTASYEPGLRLYSNGVMIMDKCADLLPEHFRFVKGVVDSPDLSLNISREMLQHDRQLRIIGTNIERRIKNELSRIMESERDKYNEFFESFGLQLKYGVIADYGSKKDMLKDLLLFHSDRKGCLISLAEYVADMKEDQKYIYFACGDTAKIASGLPQTETVRDAGYDILCMTESIDEFVTGILGEYGEKPFKSVNDDDLGIEGGTKKEDTEKLESDYADLLEFVKESLGGKVAAVKISKNLKSHPVCLSTQGMITLEMEKYFSSLPSAAGENIRAERVLELNPDHRLFKVLDDAYINDRGKAKELSQLLCGQAELIAGYLPDDPAEFALLISRYIS